MTPSHEGGAPRRSWLRRWLNRLEVDQAVFFSVAMRGWQLVAGPLVLVLVATFFTPELQGYYFTFASLLNLQWFAELGLRIAVLNLTSHEWSHLQRLADGRIVGDARALSRLSSLLRQSSVWFLGVGLVFSLAAGAAGVRFFLAASHGTVEWKAPWLALVLVTAAQLAHIPFTTVLDGCGQIRVTNRYRFAQSVLATLTAVVAIPAGAGLWTAPLMAAARLSGELALVLGKYRGFLRELFKRHEGPSLSWGTEVYPLQWRLAVQCLFLWFGFSLFNPVLFHYHGSAEAGKMGMTWAALTAIQAAALAWVETRASLFGSLVARKEFAELDRVFFRLIGMTLRVLAFGVASFVLLLVVLEATAVSPRNICETLTFGRYSAGSSEPIATRLLTPTTAAFFGLGLLAQASTQCLTYYLRAHKQDPLMVAATVVNIFLGVGVWGLGSRYGALGAAAAWVGVQTLIALPCWIVIWKNCRREWHAESQIGERGASAP